MTDHITTLHPDLNAFRTRGGLFDVPITELDADIGRRCVITDPRCPAEQDTFTVATTQKNYRGDVVYRLVGDADFHKFGRPCDPARVRFIK